MRTALVVVAARAEVRLLDSVLPFSAQSGTLNRADGRPLSIQRLITLWNVL